METIIQGRTKGSVRMLWVMAIIGVIGLAWMTRWFTKPLPPPVVSLSLVGFKVSKTNVYAVMTLSNRGTTSFYFDEREWKALFQTRLGFITNSGSGWETLWKLQPSSNVTFNVKIPAGASKFKVEVVYEYLDHHDFRSEMEEWIPKSGVGKETTVRAFQIAEPLLVHLPVPEGRPGSIDTGWLTNPPPSASRR